MEEEDEEEEEMGLKGREKHLCTFCYLFLPASFFARIAKEGGRKGK